MRPVTLHNLEAVQDPVVKNALKQIHTASQQERQLPIANNTVVGNVNATGTTALPGSLNQTQLTALVKQFSSSASGAVPATGNAGSGQFLNAAGQWASPPQTTLPGVFTATANGLAPFSGGGTLNFLRADGQWVVPPQGSSGTTTPALKTFINVTDPAYGAVGDGVSDNTNALIAAVAFMLTLPAGGCIYFPAGKYHFASAQTITYPSSNALFDCTIIGDGRDATILDWGATAGLTIAYHASINARQSFHCRDVTFTTSGTGAGTGLSLLQGGGNSGSNATLSEITRVTFRGDDGPAGLHYWQNDLNIFGVSNVNVVGCGCFGPAIPAGGGIVCAGQNINNIAVVHNIISTTINFHNVGLTYGDFLQGVTVTAGCNITGNIVGISVPGGQSGADAQLTVADSQIGCFVSNGACIVTASALNALMVDNMTFVVGNGSNTANTTAINVARAANFSITNSLFQCTNHSPGGGANIAISVANSTGVGFLADNTYTTWDIAENLAATSSNVNLGQRNFVNCTTTTINSGTSNFTLLRNDYASNFSEIIQNGLGSAGAHGVGIRAGLFAASGDSTTLMMAFASGDGSNVVGSIQRTTAGGVAYNQTSDERLKVGVLPCDRGLWELRDIDVVSFIRSGDPTSRRAQGFLAQRLMAQYPEAVRPGGDDPHSDPWQVDYGRLTPLLVRAVQQLADRVDELEGNRLQ